MPKKEIEPRPDYTPLYVLCLFTLIMLTIPMGVFFLTTKYYEQPAYIASAAAAVSVQFVIGAYVYYGWREENQKYESEQDEINNLQIKKSPRQKSD